MNQALYAHMNNKRKIEKKNFGLVQLKECYCHWVQAGPEERPTC
jgi:hypothetical protein